MISPQDYKMGSIVVLKKQHPSKTIEWEIVRTGLDIKLKSTTVKDTYIILPRPVFHRKVLEVK